MTIIPIAKSGFSPALATFHSRVHVAWTTTYEIRLASSDTGEYWGNDYGLGEYSYHGPALAVFNDRLYIAWTGTDEYALVNVMSSQDGENFNNKVTLSEDSAYGPALAVFNDRLYLAWTGTDYQHSLNVISSADGVNFSDKHILGQSSIGAPALAATVTWFWDESWPRQSLFIAWTSEDKGLNIAGSADGATFDFTNTRVPDEQSNQGPALRAWVIEKSGLWFCWTGTDAHLNILKSAGGRDLPGSFENKQTSGDQSIDAPSLAWWTADVHGGFIAWSGTDDEHHVNVKVVQEFNGIPREF